MSRFATLPGGLQVELMAAHWIEPVDVDEHEGWDHIAISLGSRQPVDDFAARSNERGYLHAEPRETGDGFYEAIIRAPDGTRIEVTA